MKFSIVVLSLCAGLGAQVVIAGLAVSLSGVVDVEYGQTSSVGITNSDIAVATVELDIAAELNDKVTGNVVLLHEADVAIEVDVADVTYKAKGASWAVKAGHFYLSFGNFESNLISDPLTLAIGEIRESALQLDIESGGLTTAIYLFNGNDKENKQTHDRVDNFGIKFSYEHKGEVNMTTGFAYINDISNTDGLQNEVGSGITDEYVEGISIDFMLQTASFNLILEHVAASDAFESNELAAGDAGSQPSATNIEFSYSTIISGKTAALSLAQQVTEEVGALGLAQSRVMLGLRFNLKDNTSLAFESMREEDYTGNITDSITIQLAVEF